MTKVCTKCQQEKPATEEFGKNGGGKFGLRAICRACEKQWHRENWIRTRYSKLERQYGMSPGEYVERLEAQAGLCAICKQGESHMRGGRIKTLAIDHDHGTGEVRGLLCHRCNLGIGHFNDDPLSLLRAVEYLQRGVM